MERADFDTPARVSQCRSAARRRGAHGHPGRGFATLSLMADQRSLFHAPPARERRSISLSGVSRRRAAGLSAAQLLALGLWPGALRAADAMGAGSFRFVVINDVHYRDERCGAWLEKVFRQIKSAPNPPDLCLMAGDYSENGTRAELGAARDAFKLLGVPVFGVVAQKRVVDRFHGSTGNLQAQSLIQPARERPALDFLQSTWPRSALGYGIGTQAFYLPSRMNAEYSKQVLDLRADGRDQPGANGELLKQCPRHLEAGRRKDDAVERRHLRQPKHTISVLQAQVSDAQGSQVGLGELVQWLDALDRIHLAGHLGQRGFHALPVRMHTHLHLQRAVGGEAHPVAVATEWRTSAWTFRSERAGAWLREHRVPQS